MPSSSHAHEVIITAPTSEPVIVHWGLVKHHDGRWHVPPEAVWPPGSKLFNGQAVQSPVPSDTGQLALRLPAELRARSLAYVFYYPVGNRWESRGGQNYQVDLLRRPESPQRAKSRRTDAEPPPRTLETMDVPTLVARIVEAEVQRGSWTLMHRFDLGTDLLDQVADEPQKLAVLYVWLRYSAIRQLDWQRRYNTQPRNLAHAQNRLTRRVAALGQSYPGTELWVRRLLSTVGRGGEGQRIRDDILRIMHRHKIPEKSGSFLEQWHQKLHNNATPDDIAICRAYLAFLRTDGSVDTFYRILATHGVNRERLRSYERPITEDPVFLAHAKTGLTHDFEHYLRLLQSVHSSTDVVAATEAIRSGIDAALASVLDRLLGLIARRNALRQRDADPPQEDQPLDGEASSPANWSSHVGATTGNVDHPTRDRGVRSEPSEYRKPDPGTPVAPEGGHAGQHAADGPIQVPMAQPPVLAPADAQSPGNQPANAQPALWDTSAASRRPHAEGIPGIAETLELALKARELLRPYLENPSEEGWKRDLWYLELALVEQVRSETEGLPAQELDLATVSDLTARVLGHLALGSESAELALVARHWNRLRAPGHPTQADATDLALQAWAVVERAQRVLAAEVETTVEQIQPLAEQLGRALGVDAWTIPTFAEEVVRGSPLSAFTRLLDVLGPLLRQQADLGDWQIVCPGRASGVVALVTELLAVQGRRFPVPTILLARRVRGEEEIPPGVVAVLTLDSPDLVSHVAVRARNAHVLFASCYDQAAWTELEAQVGLELEAESSSDGSLLWKRTLRSGPLDPPQTAPRASLRRTQWAGFACSEDRFGPERVGAKSISLARLRRLLPDAVQIPPSVALPFGSFEATLQDQVNTELHREYQKLMAQLPAGPEPVLDALKSTVLRLRAPTALVDAVSQTADRAGINVATEWEKSWQAIQAVWASQWNRRAYHARKARGVVHQDLRMAVLVQPLIPAEYAFVLHTVDPITRNAGQLYGEMVIGLGETLVGNDPGRALGFRANKTGDEPTVVAYPSKSHALRGQGLIFRSDSNDEDLQTYAGAGLYDSVTNHPYQQELIDYVAAPLVWDTEHRQTVLRNVVTLGLAVERALTGPQDVEGVWLKGEVYLLQSRAQVGL
ncbi:phosphohistidine-like domain-containing protein [Myxococcota bacterium]